MIAGLEWADVCRDFAVRCGWTPHQVLFEQTLAQFLLVWCGGDGRSGGHDPDAVRDRINRRRAEKGLPPMKPAPKGRR